VNGDLVNGDWGMWDLVNGEWGIREWGITHLLKR